MVPASAVGGAGGQNQRLVYETLTLDPNDPTKVLARIRHAHPNGIKGEMYEQVDKIPILDSAARSPAQPKFYFLPNLSDAKIPPKNRASKKNNYQPILWVRQGNSNTWMRQSKDGGPDDVWHPVPLFRRFNATTHKYEEAYVSLPKIKNPDPNDIEYAHGYNKWIDQIKRRRDDTYQKVVCKDHWTIPERRALYSAINSFVREKGLRHFGFGDGVMMTSKDLDKITTAVNAAGTTKRKTDAVRGQIHSSHMRKNKAIYELIERAKALRERLKAKEKVPRAERYPVMAIPEHLWPVEQGENKKRKTADIIDDTDSGLSDTPIDVDAPARVLEAHPIWARRSLSNSGVSPKHKEQKPEDAAGNEVACNEASWNDTDEPMTDATVSNSGWETDDASQTEVNLRQQGTHLKIQAIIEKLLKPIEEDLRRRTALEVQAAIEESLQPGPILTGIAMPGEIASDSDDDNDVSRPTGHPLGRDKQHHRVRTAATPSAQKKRKRTSEPKKTNGSDGDDEAEMGAPQTRSFKKIRHQPR
ncbi:hypothetical protein DE146DRAFT_614242 [Phaeosphaeria sp. MPI-PUGE-AT-0046c]|nr:hypothetical protein DE146DRAFT_614242 [Phaeosphaeria sp. MPI-PUGE-AT-0046c]